MGVGRSGSTILGVVLGNLQNYFFGGEMHLWIESKGVPTERDYAIEYWKKIADKIPAREQYFPGRPIPNPQRHPPSALPLAILCPP